MQQERSRMLGEMKMGKLVQSIDDYDCVDAYVYFKKK